MDTDISMMTDTEVTRFLLSLAESGNDNSSDPFDELAEDMRWFL